MRLHPVLGRPLKEGEGTLRGDVAHHLARVLRVRAGSRLRAFDGNGLEADAEVVGVSDHGVMVRCGPIRAGVTEPPRSVVPGLYPPCPAADRPLEGPLLVAHPKAERTVCESARQLAYDRIDRLATATGPEGGWTDAELGGLVDRGANLVTLGPRILRAATAPIALAAVFLTEGI